MIQKVAGMPWITVLHSTKEADTHRFQYHIIQNAVGMSWILVTQNRHLHILHAL